jgi:putative transposase
MPRTARTITAGYPHHIILRGNNRRRICSYATDYKALLRFIAEAAQRYPCLIHCICILANHVHLIVAPRTAAALSAFVKRFAQRYAQYRNAARDGTGKLFEQRFQSKVIEDDAQLAACTAYVERNPIEARIVTDAGDYEWSSYRLHSGDPRRSLLPAGLITPSPWYEGLGRDPAARALAYRIFFAGMLESPEHVQDRPAPSRRRLERPNRKRAS